MIRRIITRNITLPTKYLSCKNNLVVNKPLDINSTNNIPINVLSKENNDEELLKELQYCAHNSNDSDPICKELLEKYNNIPKDKDK